MHIEVASVAREALRAEPTDAAGERSSQVRARVERARERQIRRSGATNAALNNRQVESVCKLPREGQMLVEQAMEKLGLSARAYHRILKVARTIADLAESESIQVVHLSEAISYRRLDRAT